MPSAIAKERGRIGLVERGCDRDEVIAGTNQKRDDVIWAKCRFWDRGLRKTVDRKRRFLLRYRSGAQIPPGQRQR